MNQATLDLIVHEYAENFETFNRDRREENDLWAAACKFQKFDVDAPNFIEMLKELWKASGNLLDNSFNLPFYALIKSAEKEPDEVRRLFRTLFSAAELNNELKQLVISDFITKSNQLALMDSRNSLRNRNNQRSAMMFLALRYPDSNFAFKAQEAKSFARQIEFEDRWGAMTSFNLDVYCHMLDEVVAAIRKNEKLMTLHRNRLAQNANLYPDTSLHILAWDVIYSSQIGKTTDYRLELKISDTLKARNRSQKWLSVETGIRENTLSGLLRNNHTTVNLDYLSIIAEKLEVTSVTELIDFKSKER